MNVAQHRWKRFTPIRLSGRCLLQRKPIGPSTSSVRYTVLSECRSSAPSSASPCALCNTSCTSTRVVPSSLAGNSYYERRFSGCGHSPLSGSCPGGPVAKFAPGDVIIQMVSTTPKRLHDARMVDLTGVQTSYMDASERDERALATMDEAIETMHLHDGGEVPALRRGDVPVGRLVVRCAYSAPPHLQKGLTSRGGGRTFPVTSTSDVLLVENAGPYLVGRHSLYFKSEDQALELARALAGRCAEMSKQRVVVRPVIRDGIAVALRFAGSDGTG